MPFLVRNESLKPMLLLLLIIAPVAASLIDTARDVYCDTAMIRTMLLRNEMNNLRALLVRRDGRLEHYLESNWSVRQTPEAEQDLNSATAAELLANWSFPKVDAAPEEAYWALVDPQDHIVLHSDPRLKGKKVPSTWDDVKQNDIAEDVVKIEATALTRERSAYNVSLPFVANGKRIGRFHSGLDAQEIDLQIAAEQRSFLQKRMWFVALILIINAGAIAGVYVFAKRLQWVQTSLRGQKEQESRKLSQIGLGLAHEVRNPLHALRLNMHTLRRSVNGKTLSQQDLTDMMRESCDEIDRLELLMRGLVQYSSPQTTEAASEIELDREISAAIQLQADEFKKRKIEIKIAEAAPLIIIRMPPTRLRAVLQELLTFSQRSAGECGRIEIRIVAEHGFAEVEIADSGRELTPTDLANLFEPFRATPYSEAGLSLALARQYAEQAGGELLRLQSAGMNRFVMKLPLSKATAIGVSS
jgi:signal transduction histidine kinase